MVFGLVLRLQILQGDLVKWGNQHHWTVLGVIRLGIGNTSRVGSELAMWVVVVDDIADLKKTRLMVIFAMDLINH